MNATYNHPEIILLQFSPEQENVGVLTPLQTSAYQLHMAHLVSQVSAYENVHYLPLSGNGLPLDDWCIYHPNVAAHHVIAGQFIDFVEATLPGWANTTYSMVSSS